VKIIWRNGVRRYGVEQEAEHEIAPTFDEHGVPMCSGPKCARYDEEMCEVTGREPERICEPAVRMMVLRGDP
jgi:hypothetical protein